jgi:hypothetical protein
MSTGLFILAALVPASATLTLPGCGGRTLLDDPSDELPLTGNGSGSDAAGGGGSSMEKDASTSTADSGSGSSSGGASGTVTCGSASCKSATQDCCTTMGTGMSVSASCVAKGACTNGVVAMCTSAADCASGDVCCGSFGGGAGGLTGGTGAGGFDLSSVSVSCEKSTCGTTGLQLCAKDAECSKGVTCQDTGFGPKVCGGLSGLLSMFGGGTGGTGGLGGLGGLGGH